MPFKVELNRDECIGCGSCCAIAPDIFEMDGDKAKVKTPQVKNADSAKEAESSCPVSCIKVTKI